MYACSVDVEGIRQRQVQLLEDVLLLAPATADEQALAALLEYEL
jgi:hypothetical protein